MGAGAIDRQPEQRAGAAPLYILSFRQRDELAALASAMGWRVIAARRADNAERRFLASGAPIAVVDARGALEDGLAATRALGGAVATIGAALIALVSRGDVAALDKFLAAGATHFLASPFHEAEFVQTLRFAERQACRRDGQSAPYAGTPLGWRLDLISETVDVTPALARLLGTDTAGPARLFLRALSPADRQVAFAALRRLGEGQSATAFAHDLPSGERMVQHLVLEREHGRIEAMVEPLGNAPDVAAAVREALTSAIDANAARRWLERQLASDEPPATQVLLIALTRFEIVNTAYGRATGDSVLRDAVGRIEQVMRELFGRSGIVARMGGAEFLVAAPQPIDRVELAAEAIGAALARPFMVESTLMMLGCRIGLASAVSGEGAADLLRRASEALADAKASDAPVVRIASGAKRTLPPIESLAADLHRAIDGGDIELLFQPQVSISSGRIVGVEALARWEHAELGVLGAETLFAAADRADLGVALSDHIQGLALAHAAGWPGALGDLRLSINLSSADIARPGFADLLLGRVDTSGFPRGRLTVEITETGLIEDLRLAAHLLAELRGAGCRIAIDDFGTGYSSLAYLKALPLDYLKIDKRLTQDIAGSARDRVVVRGVIEMGRSLGLSVIAEGVETREQLDLLAREGCNYYQGFLCAPPLDDAALIGLVSIA